ncbi:hypothetical protein EDD86DRAFT_194968 [Gorgonomyces haynaldii]|nr:hypothetical protein EDD86DRAFT_194968 [Gorgonomyces haynaldii]
MPPPGQPLGKTPVIVPIPQVQGRRSFLTIDLESTLVPTKRINEQQDMDLWQHSEAYYRFLDFIMSLNQSVINKKISDKIAVSQSIDNIVNMLERLIGIVDTIPPDTHSQRFGNTAFRTFLSHIETLDLLSDIVPPNHSKFIPELAVYLHGGFGDKTRLDYGSGHELSFTAWLNCLELLGILTTEDYPAIVLRVFVVYLKLVRKLQQVYHLEPAGSHGVWGLDDFQFLPYYWGSAQLLDHKHIKPSSITKQDIVEHFSPEYLYLGCVHQIMVCKRGPFHEHSPMLYDISGVQLWSKVNSGMLKMYVAEVLAKFPVVQHLPFGSLLPFDPAQQVNPNA